MKMRSPTRLPASWALACLLTACPDANEDDGADDGGRDPGCMCIADQSMDQSTPLAPTCGTLLCPRADYDYDNPEQLPNTDDIDCALTALRDRTPGFVRWYVSSGGGQETDEGYILINADGTAVHRHWGNADLAFIADDAVFGELRPAADYDACLANADPLQRLACLRQTLASESAVCDPGWFIEYI